jgi:hypothetical protein
MKFKLWKLARGVAFTCGLAVAAATAAHGQLPDIPGHTGGTVRPDRSAAEDAASRSEAGKRSRGSDLAGFESLTISPERVNDQFAQYSAIEKSLGIRLDTLKDEYAEDRQYIPGLQPKQLFAIKLLVRGANKMHPDKVTKRGFLDKLKERVGPRAYLQGRGFTKSEVDELFGEVGKTLAQVRKESEK